MTKLSWPNKSGIIFPAVMWLVIAVTSLLLVQRQFVREDIKLVGHAQLKTQALANAFSGIAWARHVLLTQTNVQVPFTPLYMEGVNPSSEWASKFTITPALPTGEKPVYGFADESGKINVNSMNVNSGAVTNQRLVEFLLIHHGISGTDAQTLAQALIDFIRNKNAPIDSLDELRQLPGMTNEIYTRIKDDLTIYPLGQISSPPPVGINVLTASEPVLMAFLQFNDSRSGGSKEGAFTDGNLNELKRIQLGADGVAYTKDDGADNEGTLITSLPGVNKKSDIFRAISCGLSDNKQVRTCFNVVFYRDLGSDPKKVLINELRQIQ